MEESRQASVELMGTAYHTGCGIQHSLQFVGRRFRRLPTIALSCTIFDMLSRFHLITERHGQTDRIAISISRVSVLTCDKNDALLYSILGNFTSTKTDM